MIKSEDARLNGWTLIDLEGVDVEPYVEAAKARLEKSIDLPPGYSLTWADNGTWAGWERRAVVPDDPGDCGCPVVPHFRTLTETLIVMLSVPFALIGGIWLVVSTTTWVWPLRSGFIAFGWRKRRLKLGHHADLHAACLAGYVG